MAQFDIYANPNPGSAKRIPYLLDVQSDLLRDLATRVVVPLATPSTIDHKPAQYLNPQFLIENRPVVMLTQELAGIPSKRLGPLVGNLAEQRPAIVRALDVVLSGL